MSGKDDELAIGRREAIAYAGGAGLGLGGWRALDNVVIGYGIVTGTNLREQDLTEYADRGFDARRAEFDLGDYRVVTDGDVLAVYDDEEHLDGLRFADATREEARSLDEEYGLPGKPFEEFHRDVTAIRDGDVRFEFSTLEPFYERVEDAESRPITVGAIRGPDYGAAESEFVGEFTDVDPGDVPALVEGLADAFREHSYYDVPRYAAGSVEDNVIFGARDLRQHFETPADFEALAAGENSGLFCTELVYRSIEAFHAVEPQHQSHPVAAGYTRDARHKHAYTWIASVVRDDGDLVVPMTFVDYTYALLYDDLHLRWLLGEGIEAYDTRHRATALFWDGFGHP